MVKKSSEYFTSFFLFIMFKLKNNFIFFYESQYHIALYNNPILDNKNVS